MLLSLTVSTTAQQPPTVVVNRPFQVLASHDGLVTTTYQLTITGTSNYSASLPVSALVGGVVTFNVPGLTSLGNHTVIVAAVGPGGTAPSAPFVFVVVAVSPNAPTNIRIIQS